MRPIHQLAVSEKRDRQADPEDVEDTQTARYMVCARRDGSHVWRYYPDCSDGKSLRGGGRWLGPFGDARLDAEEYEAGQIVHEVTHTTMQFFCKGTP